MQLSETIQIEPVYTLPTFPLVIYCKTTIVAQPDININIICRSYSDFPSFINTCTHLHVCILSLQFITCVGYCGHLDSEGAERFHYRKDLSYCSFITILSSFPSASPHPLPPLLVLLFPTASLTPVLHF